MKTFLEWLVERQMMMFSTKPVELYHGTNTGKDNSVLNHFKEKGVLPTSKGHGQGSGFYVFSDRKSAADHAILLPDYDKWPAGFTTYADNTGLPMVVTIKAVMEPSEWDVDYELNAKSVTRWIRDNWGLVERHMGDTFDMERTKRFHYPATMSAIPGAGVNPGRTGVTFYPKGELAKSLGGGGRTIQTDDYASGSVASGEILGTILGRLQQREPDTVHKFEELFFANMGPGVAVKYVGSHPLKPERIEILNDGRWVEA